MESDRKLTSISWAERCHVIATSGMEVIVRGRRTREFLFDTIICNLNYPIVSHPARKLNRNFMHAEAAWIIRGSDRLDEIEPHLKKFREYSDDGIRLAGAYGPMFVSQLSYVISALQDPTTRQAVMTIWRPSPRPSRDIPCTISLQFLIRCQMIHCLVSMRSSDAWIGLPYDIFCFSMMTRYVLCYLPDDIMPGNLVITAGSRHIYEEDWEAAQAMNPYDIGPVEDVPLHRGCGELTRWLEGMIK